MADANLEVVIRTVDRASRQIKGVERSVERLGDRMDRTNSRVVAFGGGVRRLAGFLATGAIGVGLVASFNAAQRAAADFEEGLIGVAKTTGLQGQELEDLGTSIQVLSTQIPVAATELAGLGQVAGQLGVTGSTNIQNFIETVARLGSASNLSGEAAAQALARILNVTGESAANVDNLAAAIVDLGNNFATSEQEIARATNEIARSVTGFEVGSARAAAFGTALSSLGVRAESGGTSVGRVFRGISSAITEGGEELGAFAEVAGTTTSEFARAFEEDATTAVLSFIEGLGKLDGIGQAAALQSVGLTAEEIAKTIGPLATNFEVLSSAVARSQTAFKENTALINESDAAFKAFNANTQILRNSLNLFATEVGGGFLDELAESAGGLSEIFTSDALLGAARSLGRAIGNAIGAVNEFFQRNSVTFAFISEALFSILESFGELFYLIGDVTGALFETQSEAGILQGIMGGIAIFVAGLVDGVKLLSGIFAQVGASVSRFLITPLEFVIDQVAALVEVFDEDLAQSLRAIPDALNAGADEAQEFAQGIFDEFREGDTAVAAARDRISGVTTDLAEQEAQARRTARQNRAAAEAAAESGDGDAEEQASDAVEPLSSALQDLLDGIPGRMRTALGKGLTFEEARDQLNTEFETLLTELQARGNQEDIDLINNLINTEAARASVDNILQQVGRLKSQLSAEVDLIRAQEEAGEIAASDAESTILKKREATRQQLQQLLVVLKQRNETLKDPEVATAITELETKITKLGENSEGVFTKIGGAIESGISNTLSNLQNTAEGVSGVVKGIVQDILASLQRLAAQRLAQSFVSSIGFAAAAKGGYVDGFAGGGPVRGPGSSTSDSIPARLSDGEYIMNAAAVRAYGPQFMEAINRRLLNPSGLNMDQFKRLSLTRPKRMRFAEGGLASEPLSDSTGTGSRGKGGQNVRIINQIDSQGVADAMATAAGERVILNVVGKNPETLRRSLG